VVDMSLNSVPRQNRNAKIGNDKEVRARSADRHAPGKQSTTVVCRQEMDVVDASRSLQSIGVRREYPAIALAVIYSP
jgi:hypothetical protein